MRLTRTTHAIGQGGFYSEQFEEDNKLLFRLVYDCGSETLKSKRKPSVFKLEKVINSDLCKSENDKSVNIDILAISHFHADHINGVEFLNPKYIVIPLLTEEQLIMLRVLSIISEIDFSIDFESQLREKYPDAKFVKVKPIEDEEYRNNNDEGLTINQGDIIIDSNEPLPASHGTNSINDFWEFRFYNPNLSKYVDKFKNELALHKLDFKRLKGWGSKTYIKKHFDDLKTIYKNIGDVNEHSLLMYSNLKEISTKRYSGDYRVYHSSIPTCHHGFRYCLCPWNDEFICIYPGGFYWGDLKITDDIIKKLSRYKSTFTRKVSFIQIPHHGSHYNFNTAILSHPSPLYPITRYPFCIVQIGLKNKYGHPCSNVIKAIMNEDGIPIIVTENQDSCFIESFLLEAKKNLGN